MIPAKKLWIEYITNDKMVESQLFSPPSRGLLQPHYETKMIKFKLFSTTLHNENNAMVI